MTKQYLVGSVLCGMNEKCVLNAPVDTVNEGLAHVRFDLGVDV